jgi:hypothetical protein
MTEPPNMDEPVTRRELHEALGIWGGNLMARMDRQAEVVTAQVTAQVTAAMSVELARQIQASDERMRDYMRALLEPHDGVPERVTKLEEELVPRVEKLEARAFSPKRRRAASRTRSRRR